MVGQRNNFETYAYLNIDVVKHEYDFACQKVLVWYTKVFCCCVPIGVLVLFRGYDAFPKD